MTKRRKPSVGLGLSVALLQLGLDPKHARLDHTPPLGLREKVEHPDKTVTYTPDEHDPLFMQWLDDGGAERALGSHNRKTFGSKATTADGDLAKIAKSKRVARQQEEFRRRMLAKATGKPKPTPPRRKRQWPKRKMRNG